MKAKEGIPYDYYYEDEDKTGIVDKIITHGHKKIVVMDNGDEMTMEYFDMEAKEASGIDDVEDSDYEYDDVETHTDNNTNGMRMPDIKVDKNGIPILSTDEAKNVDQSDYSLEEKNATPKKKTKYKNQTLEPIFKKANKEEKEINIVVTIKILPKPLVDGLRMSVDDSFDDVIQYIINNLDENELKEGMKKSLEEIYGQ